MRSESARLGGISLNFAGVPPKRDESFPYEHAKWVGLARWDRVFFNHFCFFQILIQ